MLENKVKKFFGRLLHFGFAGGVICAGGYAVIVLIEQGLTWLQSGKLLPASIAGWLRSGFGITDLKTESVGLNKIIDWCLGLHVAFLMMGIVVVCTWVWKWGCRLAENAETEIRRRQSPRASVL